METEPNFEDRMVAEAECLTMTGISRPTRWRMERAGTFPARVAITKRRSAYRLSELREWFANPAAYRHVENNA